jgi:hypothetical protein
LELLLLATAELQFGQICHPGKYLPPLQKRQFELQLEIVLGGSSGVWVGKSRVLMHLVQSETAPMRYLTMKCKQP